MRSTVSSLFHKFWRKSTRTRLTHFCTLFQFLRSTTDDEPLFEWLASDFEELLSSWSAAILPCSLHSMNDWLFPFTISSVLHIVVEKNVYARFWIWLVSLQVISKVEVKLRSEDEKASHVHRAYYLWSLVSVIAHTYSRLCVSYVARQDAARNKVQTQYWQIKWDRSFILKLSTAVNFILTFEHLQVQNVCSLRAYSVNTCCLALKWTRVL